MSNKDKLLEELQLLQLEELIQLLKSGEATPSHHAVIRGLLKDNNVLINRESKSGDPLANLLEQLGSDET
jgi:hypothetical protein